MTKGPQTRPGTRSPFPACLLQIALCGVFPWTGQAQTNNWTSPADGDWHGPGWSLGQPPGPGQHILIANPGSKTVSISSTTADVHADTLTVASITLVSDGTHRNRLTIDRAGLSVPLTTAALWVGTSCSTVVLGSALRVTGPDESTFSVGGVFGQGGSSVVVANQMDIGYTGPGVYTLTNGSLSANHLYLGGLFGGVVEQRDGSVRIGVLHLGPAGTYLLTGGDYSGTVYFDGGVFRQEGGRFNHEINVYRGTFMLTGGEFQAPMGVPDFYGMAEIVQTGGTNRAPRIRVGDYSDRGSGTFWLSNGLIQTPETAVRFNGTFNQSGGVHVVEEALTVHGALVNRGMVGAARFNQSAGNISTPVLSVRFGYFAQSGGTNQVGHLALTPSYETSFTLSGGLLMCGSTTVDSSSTGGFLQTGGFHHITNTLAIAGGTSWFRGYTLAGGEMTVSNVAVRPGGLLRLEGGALRQSGTLMLDGGTIDCAGVQANLGPLQLGQSTAGTNCVLRFGPGSATAAFASSREVSWPAPARLLIVNWAGSPAGQGFHQVRFHTNDTGLTISQVGQVWFTEPAGFAPGIYPARLLDTGEVVPDAPPPVGNIPPLVQAQRLPAGGFRVMLRGEPGKPYAVEVSTDLWTWSVWTNGMASTNGWVTFGDPVVHPGRFYRALLLP